MNIRFRKMNDKCQHHDLKRFSPPNIVWALVPAVAASLKNTVPTFNPIKKPRLTHNPSTILIYHKVTLLVCGNAFPSLSAPYFNIPNYGF
jgi:hypothetical protein